MKVTDCWRTLLLSLRLHRESIYLHEGASCFQHHLRCLRYLQNANVKEELLRCQHNNSETFALNKFDKRKAIPVRSTWAWWCFFRAVSILKIKSLYSYINWKKNNGNWNKQFYRFGCDIRQLKNSLQNSYYSCKRDDPYLMKIQRQYFPTNH